MRNDLQAITAQVQHNCHISDAQHARNYSLCIYLLKMREYFRWEMGLGYAQRLPEKQLGDWLTERERLWGELEEDDYQPIEVKTQTFMPFEPELLNEQLLPDGLVYSGGYGGLSKPHFFLAELHERTEHLGHRVLITAREYARDLTAPPAMSLNGVIYVRQESLRRLLWEKIEEWRWRRKENAMARALHFYPIDNDLERTLNEMTITETTAAVWHELGEVEAGELLGSDWEKMLNALWHTKAELVARAVRDHLADCLTTLPNLLAEERIPSLHFYMANLTGMRQALFPALQIAYKKWCDEGSSTPLHECINRGQEHWLGVGRNLLQAYAGVDDAAAERIDAVTQGIEF
ncbi:MAG: Sfum_1244 family protein [Thiohalomonadaceae bacterium]